MRGENLETIFWMRLERLHHRVLRVEDWIKGAEQPTPQPAKPPMDIISTASKAAGLLLTVGRLVAWSMPYILIAAALVWSWIKPTLRWALGFF